MKLDFIKMVLNGVKTIASSQQAKDVMKYIGTITLAHAARKYGIGQYKYDSNDMKNMVYHHNINNNHCIDKNEVDTMTNLLSINRFINELPNNEEIIDDPMTKLVDKLSELTNDNHIFRAYNNMLENNIVQQFDYDTLETSSIADSYEISSGGIYLPDRSVITTTPEGSMLADAKNEYLEKRMELGEDANVKEILKEFYNKIEFDKVLQYFNN